MPNEMGLLWEVSIVEFLIVTVVLAGGGAWMIGRSTALTWSGWGILVFYVVLLAIATRFLHFALFEGTFFLPLETLGTALHYAVVDFVILMAIASVGRLFVRSRQMERQYGFLQRAPSAGETVPR
ncbi:MULTISPECIES: DUF6867 family protein [unclassified Aureimonas]|uniref:DUF6867 family protein n=1 Tax=unclassified Aureimonas TaxID=2615206 RepID=UPI0006F2434C|nr:MULTISPECIES: hypothetical protein [unclassified Aureimonas]KQT55355.1 hypothetical protein ASG62_11100 [Aureimonas sp. Leaf427]KQT71146.1 hypothetical protein ASG54_21485 [Aureimonas sp. Leaf460]